MAKIRSTTELIYDSRNCNKGIIQLEIDGWEFKPTKFGKVICKILDTIDKNHCEKSIQW